MKAIGRGELDGVRDILAAVTPGGGKSLLPVIAAAELIAAGRVERVVWVVPRDSLRLQAEEAFADPGWRDALGHRLSVRAADNEPDPSRGLVGYITTYEGIAAAPELHLAEMRHHRTLLVVDEAHHLPGLADDEPGHGADAAGLDEVSSWSRALLPLLECAGIRLLLSGTLERADGRAILWLPYRPGPRPGTRRIDMEAPGWAVVGCSRAQAVADRAVLPVTFGALDGEATWAEPLAGGAGETRASRLALTACPVRTRPRRRVRPCSRHCALVFRRAARQTASRARLSGCRRDAAPNQAAARADLEIRSADETAVPVCRNPRPRDPYLKRPERIAPTASRSEGNSAS